MPLMKDMFDFTPVTSWVENFNESTRDEASRTRIVESFVMLPEVEEAARIVLDRIYRKQGRGFFITGLYGSGKTIFMAWLSAILTNPALRKQVLDGKPEWGLDALAGRKYLTINFTAIEVANETLEEAFWHSVTDHLSKLTPPETATLSNTDAYLDTFFNHTSSGLRADVEEWLKDKHSVNLAKLKTYDKEYQKSRIEQSVAALNIQLREDRTTVTEKVKKLVDIAKSRGFDGVLVFIDELYLHLIQSDDHFNQGTAFLGQLAEAGLAGDQPFWVFGAVQEEIQAIARQAGRNFDAELMGRLAGQAGRFQSINIPVTQFHRIYNHRLFRENSKCVNKLAQSFKDDIQPHYRNTFSAFFKRYFREREPVTDESKHFADVYPVHPFALYCLTAITNRGGRSRGALGFVQEFIDRRIKANGEWNAIAVLDDVFDYDDLRNKIISDDPEMEKYYRIFEHFCSTARDEVLNRAPYRMWDAAEKDFAKAAAERLMKALIVLSMVKEELELSKLNDALLLRWPGKENDPAGSDAETKRLLEKIEQSFPSLRHKGSDSSPTYFLSIEGDGGEREELLAEIERVVNGFSTDIQTESAYRSQIELFLRFPGSPLGGTVPPQHGFATQVDIDWQRTARQVDYRLETVGALVSDHAVTGFLKDVPASKALHLVLLYPSEAPLDVEIDKVQHGNTRTLAWLPATLPSQDVDEIKRSMALVKQYGDYQSQVNAGGASQSVRRKLDLLREMLDLPAGAASVQPSRKAIEKLVEAYTNGEIRQWNSTDQVWETLCTPGELLSLYNSIPQNQRSLQVLIEKIGTQALTKVFTYHPDFQSAYTFTADLSSAMRKRVLEGIWKGRATDGDGSAKGDLERYLAPLKLLDTSVSGEVSVTLGVGSDEAFRKLRERIRDNIRHATPKATSIAETRKRLRTTDLGLTDIWVDIALTVLISTGEVSGYTVHGKTVSQDDRSVGSPVDWLQELDELRPGTRPDEALWRDVTEGLRILGLWGEGSGYTPVAAERLLEALHAGETKAKQELLDGEQALNVWPEATIPTAISELVDILSLPEGGGDSRLACFNAVRHALRDVVGLTADDDVEAANRYTCIEEFATRLREARDFMGRVSELAGIHGRLRGMMTMLWTQAPMYKSAKGLEEKLRTYVASAGTDGDLSVITAEWKDLQQQYVDQYVSEHAGLHKGLKELRDAIMTSPDYTALKNLSLVEGLSAHYAPARIDGELQKVLENIQIDVICGQSPDQVKSDVETSACCSVCKYKLGKQQEIKPERFLKRIGKGVEEYISSIRGSTDNLKDYVADHADAGPLLGLLDDPVNADALAALADESMRDHLAKALADASAFTVNVDEFLEQLKPRLLGFFAGGRAELQQRVAEESESILKNDRVAEDGQPWKVE